MAPHAHPGLHLHHAHKGYLAHADADTDEVYVGRLFKADLSNTNARQLYLKQKELLIFKLRKITVTSPRDDVAKMQQIEPMLGFINPFDYIKKEVTLNHHGESNIRFSW